MKFDDILGIGKVLPIDKLIGIISNSFGRISKSYFDKKDVDTKAYEIRKLAEARAEEMKILSNAVNDNFQLTGGIEYKEEKLSIISPKEPVSNAQQLTLPNAPIEQRIKERINFQETKKQFNIESITAFAAEELKNEPPITDEPLDEDWTTRFFKISEDISNEEMQALWGKILAGEIKQPKSYSLRTLELIRNLSKSEADIFMKIANFAIESSNRNYIFKGNEDNFLSNKHNIKYNDIALLIELGLIQPGDFVNHQFLQQSIDIQRFLVAGNIILIIKVKANTPDIKMPVYVFSNTGNELLKLVKPNPPFDYLSYFSNSIKSENVEVQFAYILSREEDSIGHTLPLQDL